MPIYVGIDIAKDLHYACITNSNGEVLSNSFPFENTKSGFQFLLSHLESFDKSDILVGYESTAHYADNLVSFLKNLDYSTVLINPLTVSALRKSNIRNTKNDKIDALLICQALERDSRKRVVRSDFYNDLLQLCRSRQNLIKARSKAKIQLVTYVDRFFPELASFFKNNLHINTSYQLLKLYPLPSQITKVRLDVFTKLLTQSSHGRFKKDKAVALKELASNSIGLQSSTFALQAQLAIDQIELYSRQIDLLEGQIAQIVVSLHSPIMTIPGVGAIQAAIILASIQNISDFSDPCKVLAFAGLDPIVRQSGKFTAKSCRMSKRGSSLLRYALIWASHNVVLNNHTFKSYYDTKVSQGKSHYNALGHCAFKLVRIIYKLLSENVSFNLA